MLVSRESIIDYFNHLDRSYFMEINKELAIFDTALPIGFGQTISQPSLVLRMTLLLEMDSESRVLEIGTGSGYQTALLARFAEEIYTVERIEPWYHQAMDRLSGLGFTNIRFRLGDGSWGWPEEGPFDRIIVTAAARRIPDELMEQLAPGGIMIIPVGGDEYQELMIVTKDMEGNNQMQNVLPVRFVRLVGKYE
jgi:protein-L-isoaspartate(D-aspartate) O-methyltransferase